MKKILLSVSLLLGVCFFMPSCTEEEWVLHPDYDGPEVPAGMGEMTFYDFDVAFDESERATYAAMSDAPVTGDINYAENHDFTDVVTITFGEGVATVENTNPMIFITPIGAYVDVFSMSANKVEFVLKGTCSDGQFKMSTCTTDYKITLSDLNLTNPNGAPIYIMPQVTTTTFISSAEGTTNTLTGCLNPNSTEKACVKGAANLIFCGKGTTTIKTNYRHAIDTNGEIYFRGGGKMNIITENDDLSNPDAMPEDGVHANGKIEMTGGEVEITSVGDGVQSGDEGIVLKGGFLKVITTGEKAHALKATKDIIINDGALHATAKGNASKAVSTDGGYVMSGGAVTLVTEGAITYDAAVHDLSSSAGLKTARDINISGGSLRIKSTGDAGKGINCDQSLYISGDAEVTLVTTGVKAVHESGLDSNPKGVSVGGVIDMSGKQLWIKTMGGTSGTEAMDAGNKITVNGGDVKARAFDDCVKSDIAVVVNGGTFAAFSDGNDGLDAPTIEINGGVVVACGTNEKADGGKGNGVNYDNAFTVNGGTIVALGGGDTMPTATTQSGVYYKGAMSRGASLCLHDASGAMVMSYTMQADYGSLDFLYCSPDVEAGKTYSLGVTVWDKLTGGEDILGFNPTAECAGETELAAFTALNGIYTIE